MSPMTPEQREEIARTVAANRAFQYALLKKKRGGVEVVTITLMPSPDDPPLFSDEYQAELERIGDAFRSGGIEVEIPFMRMDSVEDGGGLIGEFIIPLVKVAPVAGVIGGIVGAWLQGKLRRKARAKVGDVELEVPIKEAMTAKEFEQLLGRLIETRSE